MFLIVEARADSPLQEFISKELLTVPSPAEAIWLLCELTFRDCVCLPYLYAPLYTSQRSWRLIFGSQGVQTGFYSNMHNVLLIKSQEIYQLKHPSARSLYFQGCALTRHPVSGTYNCSILSRSILAAARQSAKEQKTEHVDEFD